MLRDPHLLKTTPYWWEGAPVQPLPETPLQKMADVAIIGAGYTGLSAGLALVRAGRSVVIFDRQHPGEGASSRNGGITSGHIRPDHTALQKKFGKERATAIEAEGKLARQHLYNLIANEGIKCDFQPVGRFTGALGAEDYENMARNAEHLQRSLGIDTFAVPHSQQHDYIGSSFYRGGTVRMDIGGLHPAKFVAELLRVALAAGVVIHSDTAVVKLEQNAGRHVVTTARGKLDARQVLVCTNGYTDRVDPWLRRRIVPVRSRIIATEELPADFMAELLPKQMMMNETRTLGFYYRPSPDGRRILFGGRDTTRHDDPAKSVAYLRENLLSIFPQLAQTQFTHTWFGNVAMQRDMIPRIFEHKGIVYAAGFCGSGVVWAPWIGFKAAHKLLGKANSGKADEPPSAFDFRPPAAIPLYTGNPWFLPFFMAKYRLDDHLKMRRADR